MKTQPIAPARIEFGAGAGEPPRSPDFDDLYHPRIGAAAQALHVFLHGNGLPPRWAARAHFTILETGFGLGNNFLATWDAWRRDPARCERLFFVSVERHPPRHEDLARVHAASPWPDLAAQLLQAWPPLVPNLHPLDFDGGRVQLLLALGDVKRLLPALRLTADAFYLDGFAPARNPDMWQPRLLRTLGRQAAPEATAATWSVAHDVRAALATAGFEVQRASGIGGKREITVARFAPRFTPRGPARAALSPGRSAVVVGAGLERATEPAQQASGNPAGLFHGTVNAADGSHARLFRAAALVAQREYAAAVAGGVPGSAEGLLQLELRDGGLAAMRATLQELGLPADYVQALDAATASQRAGVPVGAPAWFYPGGGWVAPPAWVRHALATPGVQFIGGVAVATVECHGSDWLLRDAGGRTLAQAPIAVLAHAAGAAQPEGGLLCGASHEAAAPDGDDTPREADHLFNLQRLQRLIGQPPPADLSSCQGRVGWRLHSDDRLPIAGAVPLPAAAMPPGQRLDQARLLPRHPGLFVLAALGSRGLTLAPLLGRLVAAQATGTPWPLEQDLADAVDPARWLVRQARAATRAPEAAQPG